MLVVWTFKKLKRKILFGYTLNWFLAVFEDRFFKFQKLISMIFVVAIKFIFVFSKWNTYPFNNSPHHF